MHKEVSVNKISTVANKTWEHMNSHTFWVDPNITLYNICKQVAEAIGIDLTPRQLRIATKEVEKRML